MQCIKREIQYKLERNYDCWFVTITKQTHRCREFTSIGCEFNVGDFCLASRAFPENRLNDANTVFVWGNETFGDDRAIVFDTNRELKIFIDMVNKYNEIEGVL
jgi:hypothetical protein